MEKKVKTIVDPRKFSEYVFKEGADHGKEIVFRSLGYEKRHSEILSQVYLRQGTEKYIKGNFEPGKKDKYGQRITIEIELPGIGKFLGKTAYIKSGWMILEDGIKLNTPFTGFSRRK